ncbi:MAG: nitronate monooxygenase [Candidatus Dormibacteria bacterium]
MAQVGTPELAAAVADSGGLGMVVPSRDTARVLDRLAEQTSGVVGINFLIPFVDVEVVEAAASRARVVEFHYGQPDPGLVERVHRSGALAAWQVGSAEEARSAEDAGCDFVVAQGIEAGGHVRGSLPLFVLLDHVLDSVEVPVVAAGGIGTARAVAAALATGAAGVRVGTRFVASAESGAHPRYVEALIEADETETVLSTTFWAGWPDAPHRTLKSCVDAANAFKGDVVGELHDGASTTPIQRFAPPPPNRTTTGAIEANGSLRRDVRRRGATRATRSRDRRRVDQRRRAPAAGMGRIVSTSLMQRESRNPRLSRGQRAGTGARAIQTLRPYVCSDIRQFANR